MAQVYRFTDENGQVRLFAEISPDPVPAAGSLIPVANATGVTVDSTTYADTIKGGGVKLTTLVFPSDQGALAVALSGDSFPRWIMASSGSDGLYIGDGARNPVQDGNALAAVVDGGSLVLYAAGGMVTIGANTGLQVPKLNQVSPKFSVTSGALDSLGLVSGTGTQINVNRDVETVTSCTFNPGAATTATVTVALSPDNVTYSTLGVETVPAGVALDGTIHLVKVRVPAGWYLKLTANAQAVLGTTTYY